MGSTREKAVPESQDSRQERSRWLQMQLAAAVGTQPRPPPRCCVCLAEKGAVWGDWKGPFTEVSRTPGSEPPSWDARSIWVTAPSPWSVTAHVLTDCGAPMALRAPRASATSFCGSPSGPPQGGTKRTQSGPRRWTTMAWGVTAVWGAQVREDGWAKGTLTMGPEPQPWASSHQGPHLRKM